MRPKSDCPQCPIRKALRSDRIPFWQDVLSLVPHFPVPHFPVPHFLNDISAELVWTQKVRTFNIGWRYAIIGYNDRSIHRQHDDGDTYRSVSQHTAVEWLFGRHWFDDGPRARPRRPGAC